MMAGLDYAGTEFAACLSRLGKGTEAWDSPNGQVIKTGPGSKLFSHACGAVGLVQVLDRP